MGPGRVHICYILDFHHTKSATYQLLLLIDPLNEVTGVTNAR